VRIVLTAISVIAFAVAVVALAIGATRGLKQSKKDGG